MPWLFRDLLKKRATTPSPPPPCAVPPLPPDARTNICALGMWRERIEAMHPIHYK